MYIGLGIGKIGQKLMPNLGRSLMSEQLGSAGVVCKSVTAPREIMVRMMRRVRVGSSVHGRIARLGGVMTVCICKNDMRPS